VRRSTRHGLTADGASVTDEDSIAKAMRRKAAVNLDNGGMNGSSKSFLSFSTPQVSANLNKVGVSLDSSLHAISVSTKALKHMDFDRLKCTPVIESKSNTTPNMDEDDEAYAISDGQLLTHLVGEVLEVGSDDAMLGSCFELKATERKSRSSNIKKSAWPNKKARVSKSTIVSK
jgi:hypothetical protein